MRSFAVIAGLAAAVNAYAYPAVNTTSVAPVYPVQPATSIGYGYPAYTTTTVTGVSTVCATPTTLKYGSKTYVVTKPTTIIDYDCVYTTTVPVKPTPTPVKPSSVVVYPSHTPVAPKPPVNATSATPTKPAVSQFTGAAAQTGAAMLAIVGAVAAFL